MLDLDHLADEVGSFDELRRRVAAGDDHVLEARAVAQGADDLVLVEPAELHRIGELVEEQELVALVGDPAGDLGPALARAVGGLLEVLADPRPAVAHLLPVDPAQLARGLVLADLPLARLDELEDPAAVAARPRAHEHPEGARRLALAVAGEDDEQRAVARLAALRVGAADVGDLGHAALLGAVGCRAASGSSRAPAARASSEARPRRTRPSSPSKTTMPSATRASCVAAARAASRPPSPLARPSVTASTSARRSGSRRRSSVTSSAARRSPAASGVAPPVARAPSTAAARSTLPVGASTTCALAPRKVTRATRSRRR